MIEYYEDDNIDYKAVEQYKQMPEKELEALIKKREAEILRKMGKTS